MAKLFLYTAPFTIDDSASTRAVNLLDGLTDTERSDIERLHAILLDFATENKFIHNRDNVFVIDSNETNMGSWIWVINWTNMRALRDRVQLDTLISSLENNDSNPLNQIVDLHLRMGVLFDHTLLNTLVNRIYQSIALIPYGKADDRYANWDALHKEFPFLWVIILLQTVIRTNAVGTV